MRTRINSLKGLVCAVAAVAAVASAHAQGEVVYDNSSDPVLGVYAPEDPTFEFGDQVQIADPENNIVTEFRLEYFSTEAAGTAVIRFRANDGAPDVESSNLEPSTLLYESDPFAVQADFNQVEITGIQVPLTSDWFTFTIEFSDLQGAQNVGLLIRNPPDVGTSFDDVWVRPGDGDWALRQIPLTTANLAAQIVAVPEPGTIALAVMGIASLFGFGYMRRR